MLKPKATIENAGMLADMLNPHWEEFAGGYYLVAGDKMLVLLEGADFTTIIVYEVEDEDDVNAILEYHTVEVAV